MRIAAATLAALLLAAAAARSQQPTVSRAVAAMAQRADEVTLWLLARPDYSLDEVEEIVLRSGGTVRRRSRWLHAVSADIPVASLETVTSQPSLRHIQPVARFLGRRQFEGDQVVSIALAPGQFQQDTLYGPSAMPFRSLNLFPLAEQGLHGAGVKIALLDTGFETRHVAFAAVNIVAQRDFVFNDSTVANQPADASDASRHGTAVWSLLAANLTGQMVGLAPEAEYILAKTEDVRSETRVEEDNYVAALEWADSLGARIASSSLSYLTFDDGFRYSFDQLNGDVAITTVAADSAAALGMLVVTSVGNQGSQGFRSLQTPADGDSVIAVGAEDSLGVLQGFSSRGPTADGRMKPDLTAPGYQVFAVDVLAGSGYGRFNGTSFSAPLIAGSAALMLELHPEMQPMDVLEAFKRTGTNAAAPDSLAGWGRPNVTVAATYPYGIRVTSPSTVTLQTVTPLFSWSTPGSPTFAEPIVYRLRVATDSTLSELILDTTLTDTEVQLDSAWAPGDTLRFEIAATSIGGATMTLPANADYVVPEWATLLTLNSPQGTTIRERQPTFDWTSPAAASPPGPFTYDIAILRVDNRLAAEEATDLTETEYTPPHPLDLNTPYRWRLIARLGPDSSVVESRSTFIVVDESVPTATLLYQNFPNPFPNEVSGIEATCIWFDLATGGEVVLDILDVRGHVVRNIVPQQGFPPTLEAGRYGRGEAGGAGSCDPRLQWDGTTSGGASVPRGIYIARLRTPDGSFLKRIVYMGARL